MTVEQFNTILLVLGFGILVFFIKNALPAYFTEKGKNLATKEDIGKITQEVESVKQEFAEQSERLRTDLQYYNQLRHSLKTEERNAIVNCYEKYFIWREALANISFASITSIEQAMNKIASFELLHSDVVLAKAKVLLFVGKGEYINSFSNLINEVDDLEIYVSERCLDYAKFYAEYESEDESSKGNIVRRNILAQELYNKKLSTMREAMDEIRSMLAKFDDRESAWQQMCLDRLNDLATRVLMSK